MKRSDAALLLPALALLAAALAYITAFVWNWFFPPLRTVTAEPYLWRDAAEFSGVVIRAEQTLVTGKTCLRFTAAEGRRVAAGDVLGIVYDNGLEYFRAALLLRLRRELALRTSDGAAGRRSLSETGMSRRAGALTRALGRRDFTALAEESAAARLGFFDPAGGEDTALLEAEIRALENAGAEEYLLTAPVSGFFSRRTDGWEALSPANARELGYDTLLTALSDPNRASPAPGRLVTGSTWLFAAVTDADSAARFTPGDTVALTLGERRVDASVLTLCPGQGGNAAVIFACRTGLEEALMVRTATGSVEFSRLEGLLLPEEAVHADGEDVFVYRLAGELARRESVTVLARLEEGVLVEAGALRAGSTVLLGENIPENGMVPG